MSNRFKLRGKLMLVYSHDGIFKPNIKKNQIKATKNHKYSGFTLLELMVVLVILGVLAAAIAPRFLGRDEAARVTVVQSNLRNISNILETYRLDNQQYPTTDEGLEALVNKPENAKNWNSAGYLQRIPKDPWGNEYLYLSPGASGPYDLLSLGADGVEGGTDYNADISADDF